jgi:hypothetical protein
MRWRSGVDTALGRADLYGFGPDLVLSVRGDRRARAHFRAEYASAALDTESSVPAVEATVGSHVHDSRARGRTGEAELRGTHKLARWRASFPATPDADAMRLAVDVRGPLGLALVQSYILEPLVSLAAVRAGYVLLPSAAIARDGKALLLIGRSRSGKSSLAALALAAGRRVLGDDQVLIVPGEDCRPFPRRLRLYPDLARTAPAAFAALRPSARRTLTGLGQVKSLTRGFVAPPLRISASALGAGVGPLCLPIGEVVVIERSAVDTLSSEPLGQRELAAEARDVLMSQRSEIFSLAGVEAAFAPVLAEEAELIERAFAGASARRFSVPDSWPAERAIGTLAHEFGLHR